MRRCLDESDELRYCPGCLLECRQAQAVLVTPLTPQIHYQEINLMMRHLILLGLDKMERTTQRTKEKIRAQSALLQTKLLQRIRRQLKLNGPNHPNQFRE